MTETTNSLRHIGASRMREAIAKGEDLIDLADSLFASRALVPELLHGAMGVLIDCYLAGRAVDIDVTATDPAMQKFLNGSREFMAFEMLQAVIARDVGLEANQVAHLTGAIKSMRDVGCKFEFNAAPSVPAAQPAINIEVHPAPVVVNNAFASKAIQTVERDARDEIVATVTTYV